MLRKHDLDILLSCLNVLHDNTGNGDLACRFRDLAYLQAYWTLQDELNNLAESGWLIYESWEGRGTYGLDNE